MDIQSSKQISSPRRLPRPQPTEAVRQERSPVCCLVETGEAEDLQDGVHLGPNTRLEHMGMK